MGACSASRTIWAMSGSAGLTWGWAAGRRSMELRLGSAGAASAGAASSTSPGPVWKFRGPARQAVSPPLRPLSASPGSTTALNREGNVRQQGRPNKNQNGTAFR